MGSKSKTDPADTVQSPKKKHSKVTYSVDAVAADEVSSKKKKHLKNKELADSDFVEPSKKNKKEAVNAVFHRAAQEEAAVSKKKRKLAQAEEEEEEAYRVMVSRSPKKSSKSEEFEPALDAVVKCPSKKRSRPDKEVDVPQSPKKKHKKIEDDADQDSDSPPEVSDQTKEQQVEKKKTGMIDLWPTEDMQILFNRIRSAIPADDKLVFKTRQENIDWNSIAFGNYSGEDCKTKWLLVVKQLRGFRLLSELVDDAIVWMQKPWTKYSKKDSKQHHPDMPHKPLSTYMLYYMENKERVKAENPGITMTSLSTLIAREYKALSEKEKKRYEVLAATKKKEYLEKMEIFGKNHPEVVAQLHKLAPKRSRTPLQIFIDDRVKKYEDTGINLAQVRDDAREKFKTLTDKKRLKWIKRALEERKIYMEKVKQFSETHPDFQPAKKTPILNRQELQLLLKDAGKPTEPPKAANQLFMREEYPLESARGTPADEIFRVLNRRWKELSTAEQQHYKNRCMEERKQYEKAYEEYLDSLDDEHRELEEFSAQSKASKSKKKIRADDDSPKQKKNKQVVFKGEPPKPPSSPYELFVQGIKKSVGLNIKNVHSLWDNLPEKDKEKFCARHVAVVETYKKKMAHFLKSLGKERLAEYTRYRGTETATEDSDDESNYKRKSSAGKAKEADSSNDSESDSEDEEGSKAESEAESSSESDAHDAKESSESEEEQEERVTNNVEIHKPQASSSSDSDSDSA